MKRLISLLFLFAAVTTTLALPPTPPAAASSPECACAGWERTPQGWAHGDTCEEAEANLKAQLIGYVNCPGARCSLVFVLTAGCHWDVYSGKWQVDGYYSYRCWWCVEE
jgi:hypothetical protein